MLERYHNKAHGNFLWILKTSDYQHKNVCMHNMQTYIILITRF